MGTADVYGAVLCAGFGTRMRPITHSVPKPLIPFLNKPMVSYPLRHYAECGILDVGINAHYLPTKLSSGVRDICGASSLKVSVSHEEDKIQGTAGGIRGIWDAIGADSGTLVVSNSDSVIDIDLESFLKRHRRSDALATLVVTPRPPGQPGGVWLDDDNQLVQFRKKPGAESIREPKEHTFTGIHFIDADLLDEIPAREGGIIEDVYEPLLEESEDRLRVDVYDGFWAAMDRPDLLFETTKRVLDEPTLFSQIDLSGAETPIHPAADVSSSAEIRPPVLIGENVQIQKDCVVGPYTVLEGVGLEEGVQIRDAIAYHCEDLAESAHHFLKVDGRCASFE